MSDPEPELRELKEQEHKKKKLEKVDKDKSVLECLDFIRRYRFF